MTGNDKGKVNLDIVSAIAYENHFLQLHDFIKKSS